MLDSSNLLEKLLRKEHWLKLECSTGCGSAPTNSVTDLHSLSDQSDQQEDSVPLHSTAKAAQGVASLLEDILLITSFACCAAWNNVRHQLVNQKSSRSGSAATSTLSSTIPNHRLGSGDFLTRNKEIIYPKDVLIALAPFWAATNAFLLLCTHSKGVFTKLSVEAESHEMKRRLLALQFLLSKELINSASMNMNEDILRHMTYSQTLHIEHSFNYSLYSRLKKTLKMQLKTPLFLATYFSLTLHTDLLHLKFENLIQRESKKIKPSASQSNLAVSNATNAESTFCENLTENNEQEIIVQYDLLSLAILHATMKANPFSALIQDNCSGQTVASIAAAYHDPSMSELDNAAIVPDAIHHVDTNFALAMMTIFCYYAPSSLALADRNQLYPIHHAARKGESSVLAFLCRNYKYTVSLQDLSNKFPLHHAILSAAHHDPKVIVSLAELYPKALVHEESNSAKYSFNILAYAAKHCPLSLVHALQDVADSFQIRGKLYSPRLSSSSGSPAPVRHGSSDGDDGEFVIFVQNERKDFSTFRPKRSAAVAGMSENDSIQKRKESKSAEHPGYLPVVAWPSRRNDNNLLCVESSGNVQTMSTPGISAPLISSSSSSSQQPNGDSQTSSSMNQLAVKRNGLIRSGKEKTSLHGNVGSKKVVRDDSLLLLLTAAKAQPNFFHEKGLPAVSQT
eukprot:scaffold725_cov162-Ochromonas_danica.AAC.5